MKHENNIKMGTCKIYVWVVTPWEHFSLHLLCQSVSQEGISHDALGCEDVFAFRCLTTYRRNVPPSSSSWRQIIDVLTTLRISDLRQLTFAGAQQNTYKRTQDGGDSLLGNVGTHLQDHTTSHPRKLRSTSSAPWEPQISVSKVTSV
jgi:hypothetical protein